MDAGPPLSGLEIREKVFAAMLEAGDGAEGPRGGAPADR